MGIKGLNHLGTDGQDRVKGHHRILKNHADAVAANIAHSFILQSIQLLTIK